MSIYAVKLDAGLAAIAGQPKIGTTRDDLFPGGRCHQIEEHVVFYEPDDREIRVARVLHKRMNIRLYL
jgi:plasmid stabilization system protein ParE